MPIPDGAHTHGSSFDWRWAGVVGVIALLAVSGGASGLFSGIQTALIWLAVVFSAAAVVTGLVAWRMWPRIRASWKPNYVESIHGPSIRNQEIDQMAALRREIRETRATRLEIERMKLLMASLGRDYSDMSPVITAEVVNPGHEDVS